MNECFIKHGTVLSSQKPLCQHAHARYSYLCPRAGLSSMPQRSAGPAPSAGAPRPATSAQPLSQGAALPAPSKVLRWWQDPTKTFGEVALMESQGFTRPGSHGKSMGPSFGAPAGSRSVEASSLHTSARNSGRAGREREQQHLLRKAQQAAAASGAPGEPSKEGMPMPPLKKRAKFAPGSFADDGAQSSEQQPCASNGDGDGIASSGKGCKRPAATMSAPAAPAGLGLAIGLGGLATGLLPSPGKGLGVVGEDGVGQGVSAFKVCGACMHCTCRAACILYRARVQQSPKLHPCPGRAMVPARCCPANLCQPRLLPAGVQPGMPHHSYMQHLAGTNTHMGTQSPKHSLHAMPPC